MSWPISAGRTPCLSTQSDRVVCRYSITNTGSPERRRRGTARRWGDGVCQEARIPPRISSACRPSLWAQLPRRAGCGSPFPRIWGPRKSSSLTTSVGSSPDVNTRVTDTVETKALKTSGRQSHARQIRDTKYVTIIYSAAVLRYPQVMSHDIMLL